MREAHDALRVEIERLTSDLRTADPADHARLAHLTVALRMTEHIQGCVALFVQTPNDELVSVHGENLAWLRERLARYVDPGEDGIAPFGGAEFLTAQQLAIAVDMVVAHEMGITAPDAAHDLPGIAP